MGSNLFGPEFLSFIYCQYRADAENEADFKYKAYGKSYKFRYKNVHSPYKPDKSIHPETRHADEIEVELYKHLGSTQDFKID